MVSHRAPHPSPAAWLYNLYSDLCRCDKNIMVAGRMILGKISERAESPETPECDEIRDLVTVTEALDGMELGRFHACHLLRMIFFWAVLAMTQECTPYLFPGLRKFLQADDRFITSFAAAFPLGCVVGSAAASLLLDRLGRRGTVIAVSPFAVALGLASMAASSMEDACRNERNE